MRFAAASLTILASTLPVAMAGKRGLAWPWYNENSSLQPGKFDNSKVSWMYNWETFHPQRTGSLEFIGMQRCYPTCDSSPVGELASRARQQGWKTVFSVNEPDVSNLSPAEIAKWYKQHIAPLNIKKALPAVTNSNANGQGLDWLKQFLNKCNGGCPHDYVNIHWYGNNFEDFHLHVEKAHRMFGKEIVVSEYALKAPASAQDQNKFFKKAVKFLDNANYVKFHSPFVATTPQLLQQNDPNGAGFVGTGSTLYQNGGALSAVGKTIHG